MKRDDIIIKPRHVPSYCVMMYILTPTMETSNGLFIVFTIRKIISCRMRFLIKLVHILDLLVSTHFADGRFADTHFADAVSPNPISPKRRFAEFLFPDKPFPRQAHFPDNPFSRNTFCLGSTPGSNLI